MSEVVMKKASDYVKGGNEQGIGSSLSQHEDLVKASMDSIVRWASSSAFK
jgi:hypothetical protein